MSLRKTAQALNDIHGIKISHQQVANYLKTAAVCIKPFVDSYNYDVSNVFTADETYIKIRGIKAISSSLWTLSVAPSSVTKSPIIAGIISMRMAFKHLKELPKKFRFIADGYSAYPLAAQQFFIQSKGNTNSHRVSGMSLMAHKRTATLL